MARKTLSKGPLTSANIGEVIIYVNDLERMLVFYNDTLGLELERKLERLAALKAKRGAEIVLHAGRRDETSKQPTWFLQFIVDDIEATVRGLETRGIKTSKIEERPYGRYARFSDPEGNLLGLEEPLNGGYQPTAPSPAARSRRR